MAFLDISPINKCHTLVIPKKHHENLLATPDELVKDLFVVVKRVGQTVKKAVQADGINFGINNGRAAGQIIFHTHIHVIPRFNSDNFTNWKHKKYDSDGEREAVAEKIKNYL